MDSIKNSHNVRYGVNHLGTKRGASVDRGMDEGFTEKNGNSVQGYDAFKELVREVKEVEGMGSARYQVLNRVQIRGYGENGSRVYFDESSGKKYSLVSDGSRLKGGGSETLELIKLVMELMAMGCGFVSKSGEADAKNVKCEIKKEDGGRIEGWYTGDMAKVKEGMMRGLFGGAEWCPMGMGRFVMSGECSGNVYEGNFTDGIFSNYGEYKVENGTWEYKGYWKRGRQEGFGQEYDCKYGIPELRYEGMWKEGRRHGKGKEYGQNGEVTEGEWVNGDYKDGKETDGSTISWDDAKMVETDAKRVREFVKQAIESAGLGGLIEGNDYGSEKIGVSMVMESLATDPNDWGVNLDKKTVLPNGDEMELVCENLKDEGYAENINEVVPKHDRVCVYRNQGLDQNRISMNHIVLKSGLRSGLEKQYPNKTIENAGDWMRAMLERFNVERVPNELMGHEVRIAGLLPIGLGECIDVVPVIRQVGKGETVTYICSWLEKDETGYGENNQIMKEGRRFELKVQTGPERNLLQGYKVKHIRGGAKGKAFGLDKHALNIVLVKTKVITENQPGCLQSKQDVGYGQWKMGDVVSDNRGKRSVKQQYDYSMYIKVYATPFDTEVPLNVNEYVDRMEELTRN